MLDCIGMIVELSEFKYLNLIPYGLESGYFHLQFSLYIFMIRLIMQVERGSFEWNNRGL